MKVVTSQESLFVSGGTNYYLCHPLDYKCLTNTHALLGAAVFGVGGFALTAAYVSAPLGILVGLAGIKIGAIAGFAAGQAAYNLNVVSGQLIDSAVHSLVGDVFVQPTH